MDAGALGVMIPIITIIGIVVTIIYLRKFENQERMGMIDKGLDPFLARKQPAVSGTLRASLLLIGAGIGLLLGYVLDQNFYMDEVAYFSMLFLCGGSGLGIAYLIEERKVNKNS